MLKLKLQYFGHLMQRVDSFEKTLMLGKIEGRRRRRRQRMRWLDGMTDSTDTNVNALGEVVNTGKKDAKGQDVYTCKDNFYVSHTSPFVISLSQHQGLFQRVSSSHEVTKVLELQLQHQSFQWIFRVNFL